jgi:hypothetical protein
MFKTPTISQLIPDSAFMTVEQYNSKEVKKQIMDEKAHQDTVRTCLTAIIKEKLREKK